ncbi:hypothetical protein D3C81_1555260 [compost metagenome]
MRLRPLLQIGNGLAGERQERFQLARLAAHGAALSVDRIQVAADVAADTPGGDELRAGADTGL